VTQSTIHQRLCDEHGLDTSIASFRRWVAANLPAEARRAQVTVLGPTPPPGTEAQVDYGKLGAWTDPRSGRRVSVWAFVMVLAYSRHMFVRPVISMDQRNWTEAHIAAFTFFGGVPARIVPDNLATGVSKADLYDPKINRAYAELAEHYGVLIDPARAFKPKDKPQVERPMPYVRDSFWRGREFASLAEMQAAAVVWSRDVAGARKCRPLDGAAPAAVFVASEAQTLQPLPPQVFTPAAWSTPKIGPDIHAKVGKTLYSVPWQHIGERLDARETATVVQFFHHGTLVTTHGRKPSGKQTDLSHYPQEKIAFHMRTPVWCRAQADAVGPACRAVIDDLFTINALFRLRSAQGILRLTDKHSPARLEAACVKAMAAGDPSYRTIRGILTAGTETEPAPAGTGDGGAAAHLHGPDALFTNVHPLPTRAEEVA
jgi:transposase